MPRPAKSTGTCVAAERSSCRPARIERAATQLVALDALEQSREVALAKSLVLLALDELEEDRADHGFGKNLEQQAWIALFGRAIQENAALAQLGDRLAMPRQALVEHFVVGCGRRRHERGSKRLEPVPGGYQVVAQERDMLDAFAVVGAHEFFDLTAAGLSFLVQGNADLAVGRGHRLGGKAGIFALDVEIANFAKAEDPLVEFGPMRHAAAIDIVGEGIDDLEDRKSVV